MTQIVQGKNRELQPLVDRRRLQPSFAALYPPQAPQFESQNFNQFYETPKKDGQYAYGDQELMNTQESTPFLKNNQVDAVAP